VSTLFSVLGRDRLGGGLQLVRRRGGYPQKGEIVSPGKSGFLITRAGKKTQRVFRKKWREGRRRASKERGDPGLGPIKLGMVWGSNAWGEDLLAERAWSRATQYPAGSNHGRSDNGQDEKRLSLFAERGGSEQRGLEGLGLGKVSNRGKVTKDGGVAAWRGKGTKHTFNSK